MATTPLPEEVRSRRLLLRRWRVEDVDLLAEAVGRNVGHLRPWMPWIADEPMTTAERTALLADWDRTWRDGGDATMAMLLDGAAVGSTGLHRRHGPDGLEIGYWVDRDHQGRGLATEAAEALTSAAFAIDGIEFVEIHHDRANARSAAVPARLGYTFIGERPDDVTAPGEVGIDCAWRVTREDWRARTPQAGREL